MKVCENCGAESVKARDMCNSCYQYWRKHGEMRQVSVHLHPHRHATGCVNCGAVLVVGKKRQGLCNACSSFLRKNGRMRTNADIKHKPGGICTNCKAEVAVTKGLCKTCYNYQNVYGVNRPRRLYSRPEHCKNCGYPLVSGAQNGIARPSKGLCRRCYEYQKSFKVARPPRLWQKGAYGWCDCGQPAEHIIAVKIHNHVDNIPVCDACCAEEMRQRAIYGDVSVQSGVDLQCKR